jgi:transketolase
MPELRFVPLAEIQRIRENAADRFLRCQLLADVFRLNALSMIMRAGSGHPGTAFSCMDIVAWLWLEEMINPNEPAANPSDTYFSSKGHDVPALYSLLIGLEKLDFDLIYKLRRLNGLPGHPHIETPYMVTNTGSLGMGISKAHGMAAANRLKGKTGRFYVLTGDGELQEGQIWESLQPVANRGFSEITMIVDHNKIQSDVHVKDTSDLGALEDKFRAFGWEVARCDGHNFQALAEAFTRLKTVKDRPQVLIADTIKGKGVSFMERLGEDGLYKFHSGAPSQEQYTAALAELTERVNRMLASIEQKPLEFITEELPPASPPKNLERLNAAYGDELVKIARERQDIVGLDADLVLDTGLIPFKKKFPERYIECGIAEQDMVSIAGGLAIRGMLPVVHSFACFLSTRPNEQIYNNATERTKIIYAASLAGLLPSTPGHSHQSVRDISCLGSVPGLVMIQPCTEGETRLAIRWAVEENRESTYIRICNVPAQISYALPEGYDLELGKGVFLAEGKDVLIIGYGPIMVEQAVGASRLLSEQGISAAAINLPWLNRIDRDWLLYAVRAYRLIVTLDDHYTSMGQGELIASVISRGATIHPRVVSFGVEEIPACGQGREVLRYHRLDAASLAERIAEVLRA